MNTEVASRNFIVDASRERIWRLIGKVIFSSLPGMEEVEIEDDRSFHAFLRVKVLLLELRMKLNGEIVDMAPPDSLAVTINLDGLRGLFKMKQKVTIDITFVETRRTGVTCKTMAEGMGILSRVFFLGQARHFAQLTFEAIEKRLKELA